MFLLRYMLINLCKNAHSKHSTDYSKVGIQLDLLEQYFRSKYYAKKCLVLSQHVGANLFRCLHLFIVSVPLLSILAPLCKEIFSFSFRHNERFLLFFVLSALFS